MPGCKLFAHVWMPEDPRTHATRAHSGPASLQLATPQQSNDSSANIDGDLEAVIGTSAFGL